MAAYGFGFDGAAEEPGMPKKKTPTDEELEKQTNADKHLGKFTDGRTFTKAQRQLAVLGFDLSANDDDEEAA